ncbi:hypothetical protein MO973_40120 [Paenibacillus sp. TRM 82003]|uniref:hypothetical protein n=1 Tax=Kineococcus sp. TRM81007 TaxID=2925831 RepID=UPI001F58CCDB|nr:hypothetical protein [Kineococcus sp. TRM81007]MCI2237121.1 hypothetical protein [Kineococcus sp. TRM81007]MCI3926408.1 hypothetical protein [Paenibacillus sp. TRM 82003]
MGGSTGSARARVDAVGARRRGQERGGPWAWLVPTAVAIAVTAWRYDAKPLWRDEVYTLATAERDWAVMLRGLRVTDAGMGPWYALVHPWVQVSRDEAWLRLPGAAATVLAAALVGLTAARVLRAGSPGGARTVAGVVAGTAFALTPVVVDHSQEARPYPVVLACVAATAYGVLRDREAPRRRWLALWVAGSVLAAALHVITGAPAVAALLAVALALPGSASRRRVLLGSLPAAAVTLAMLAVGFSQAPGRIADDFPLLRQTLRLSSAYAGGALAVLALTALCLAGVVHLRRDRAVLLLLLAWAAAPVAALAASAAGGQLFAQRYAAATAPALAVLAGAGAGALARRLGTGSARAAVAVLAAGAIALGQAAHLVQARQRPYVSEDVPAAAAVLAERARPGDAVVLLGNTTRPHLRYYLPDGTPLDDALLARDTDVSVSIGGDDLPDDQRAAALAGHERVWLVGVLLDAPWEEVFASWVEPARTGRTMTLDAEFGQVRVELWER